MTIKTKLLIIGTGPAGYTAGIYTGRANLKPLILTGHIEGGQLTQTPEIENFPGFPSALGGFELMTKMKEQAENYGATIKQDTITSVDFSKRPFALTGENETYEADSVIIATGAVARGFNIESEKKYTGKGVSYCATCDGFFYKGKKVAVLGGGDTAVEEALYLSNFCEHVTLVHRRDELRAEKIMQDKLFAKENIDIIWDSLVEEFVGDDMGLSGVKIKNKNSNEETTLEVAGAFVAIGYNPSSEVFKGAVEIDEAGYIIKKCKTCQTSVEGVFVCGDVSEPIYKQAVIASGNGAIAAIEAEKFLN